MIKNIFLEVEYDGTNYFGFQIQDKKHKKEETVQAVLERALEKLLGEKVRIVYTGRTDRGVHACAQGVNFKAKTQIPLKNLKRALNSFLPEDIRVKKVKNVSLSFHARFSAISKIYRYVILTKKQQPVFTRNHCWHIPQRLDWDKMKQAAARITGKRDFYVFAKEAKKYKSCDREIKSIIFRKSSAYVYIDIEADGFLRSMARNIVSFLVKVGQNQISLSQVRDILDKKTLYINKSAPPQGLYLLKVNYH